MKTTTKNCKNCFTSSKLVRFTQGSLLRSRNVFCVVNVVKQKILFDQKDTAMWVQTILKEAIQTHLEGFCLNCNFVDLLGEHYVLRLKILQWSFIVMSKIMIFYRTFDKKKQKFENIPHPICINSATHGLYSRLLPVLTPPVGKIHPFATRHFTLP